MSECGGCPTALSAVRLGYEPIPFTTAEQQVMEEGKLHEDLIIARLVSGGYIVTDREREVSLTTPLFTLTGHIDGIAHKDGVDYLLEMKALGRFTFAEFKKSGLAAFQGYAWQISAYQSQINLPVLLVVKCRDTGELIKEVLLSPIILLADIVEKLSTIETYVREGVLAPNTCTEKERARCKVRYMCQRGEKMQPTELQPSNLVEAAQLWKEASEVEKVAGDMKSLAKATFLAHCKETGVAKYQVEGVSISYRGLVHRETLDRKILAGLVSEEIIKKALVKGAPWEDISIRVLGEG